MNRRGMTLLELVVGLTVTGLVLTAGFAALGTLGDRRRQVVAAMNEEARAATERAELVAWLAGTHLVTDEGGPEFRALDDEWDGRPADELTFLTTAPTPLGTGETLVRLYVDRDSATPERGLSVAFAEWRGTASKRLQLDSQVVALDARYLTGVMGRRAWLPSWISSTVLPAGVEIRLLAASRDTLPPLLRLPLLLPLRNGS